MNEKTTRHLPDYILPLIVVGLLILTLFSNGLSESNKYSPRDAFAGCYRGVGGSDLELATSGNIRSNGIDVGRYQIVSPVGGKHGYLVEASHVDMHMTEGKLTAISGSDGFFWDISSDGTLIVVFAPDSRLVLQKSNKC